MAAVICLIMTEVINTQKVINTQFSPGVNSVDCIQGPKEKQISSFQRKIDIFFSESFTSWKYNHQFLRHKDYYYYY